MKHLQSFNEKLNFIDHVDQLIDWNKINYIVDKLTKYEDIGHTIIIDIMYYHNEIGLHRNMYFTLCNGIYSTNHHTRRGYYANELDIIQQAFADNRIFYNIKMIDKSGGVVNIEKIQPDITKLLSSKMKFLSEIEQMFYLAYQWIV